MSKTCGDFVVDSVSGEECDDGNRRSGDGCSEGCRYESTPDIDAGLIDAAPEDAPEPAFFYEPSNFDPAQLQPSPGIVLDCGNSEFDSTTLSFTSWCNQTTPSPIATDDLVILPLEDLEVVSGATLTLTGNRSVILAVFGNATIAGTIDASASGATPGPGGVLCTGSGVGETGSTGLNNGGGGGGAGFGTDGGDGGDGDDGAKGGKGMQNGNSSLVPLRGGCSGGNGGPSNDNGSSGGVGGGGGGGLQISAASVLDISGVISAGGGGGQAGIVRDGAGGGGSGGGILLEGDSLLVTDTAAVTANGGGGGEGGGRGEGDAVADSGDDGSPISNIPAAGGRDLNRDGGDGGAGGTGTGEPREGRPGSNVDGGGGGGGGAVGRIRFNAATLCQIDGTPTLSPSPTRGGSISCSN